MSNQSTSRKVCYHIMEGSRYIFADERNKKKLLDIILAVQRAEGWRIYAFCITDDRAYFMVEASGKKAVLAGMHRAEELFLQVLCRSDWNPEGIAVPELSGSVRKEILSLEDIALCCRKIHRIPLEEGYVHRIMDYWWSSYVTYIGDYDWKLVDCHVLFLYFSVDVDAARRMLQQYHHKILL